MGQLGRRRERSLNARCDVIPCECSNDQLNPRGPPSPVTARSSASSGLDVQLSPVSSVWSQILVCPPQRRALRAGTWSAWCPPGTVKRPGGLLMGVWVAWRSPHPPSSRSDQAPAPSPQAPYRLSARRHTARHKCSAELLLPPD